MTLALRGGMVWDGLGDGPREATVVIDGDRIAAIGPDSGAPDSVDVSGLTVIPGLIEGHAHLCFNAATDWRAVYDSDSAPRMLLRMAAAGRSMLEAGITTVRDLGAPTALSIEMREAFATGLALGPRLLVSGAPITTTGGHCWFMGGEADSEVEVRREVRKRVKAGCDWIKVMATGGNMTRGTNTFEAQFTVDELRACVAEAHRLNRKVAAHAHGSAGIAVAVEAGVDMLEHCTFDTPDHGIVADPAVVAGIARKGIVVSPTVSIGYRAWRSDGRKSQRAAALREMVAAGCPMLMSTDCGIPGVPHDALAGGMEVLSEYAKIPPIDVLKLATSTAAQRLGLPDRGVLAEGRLADVLVVEGDPTRDLAALGRVRMVFKGGLRVR
ncbi:MAG: amidohydrolase family protein [Chloroflexi bacterium]|nr:amidohydrolase family protein [Chloroflexota bacterium]